MALLDLEQEGRQPGPNDSLAASEDLELVARAVALDERERIAHRCEHAGRLLRRMGIDTCGKWL